MVSLQKAASVILFVSCLMAFSFDSYATDQENFIKCETPLRLSLRAEGTAKIAVRPDVSILQFSRVSPHGFFRVHYDTTGYHAVDPTDTDKNGTPDYVDSTLVYLDYAYNLIVNDLGFRAPVSDNGKGGGDEVDCYLREFGSGGYGYTESDAYTGGPSSAYLFIDNNYREKQYASNGMKGLKVTTAHEFFHVIQFAYVVYFALSLWMELSAVWMEEQAWSDINDYLAYINYYFQDYQTNKTPLDSNIGSFMYGAAIWPMYLSKRFDTDIVRRIWEQFASNKTHTISMLDPIIPIGLSAAFNEFSCWNYFTNLRANTAAFHTDSDKFPYTVIIDAEAKDSPSSGKLTMNHLTSRYLEILFVGAWGDKDALRITTKPTNGSFAQTLILYNSPTSYQFIPLEGLTNDVPLGGHYEKGILVDSCISTNGSNFYGNYELTILPNTGVEIDKPELFSITGVYPNPFNPATSISFSLAKPGEVTINAYSISGQKAADIFTGYLDAGEKQILWKPEGLADGIYLITVSISGATKTVKSLYLK